MESKFNKYSIDPNIQLLRIYECCCGTHSQYSLVIVLKLREQVFHNVERQSQDKADCAGKKKKTKSKIIH